MRVPSLAACCLMLAACASAQRNAVVQSNAVPPPKAQPEPVANPSPSTADAPAPESVSSDESAPRDDPRAALRFGYPPGTILRFSRKIAIPRARAPVPRPKEIAPSFGLLVFRWCGADGTCEDEVAVREPDASSLSLISIRKFSRDTGLIEGVNYMPGVCSGRPAKCVDSVFELTVERGAERFAFCVWPLPPYPTKLLAVSSPSTPHCQQAGPPLELQPLRRRQTSGPNRK
jgi:hypothetical protein